MRYSLDKGKEQGNETTEKPFDGETSKFTQEGGSSEKLRLSGSN